MKRLYQKLQQVPVIHLAIWAIAFVVIVHSCALCYYGFQLHELRAEINAVYRANTERFLQDEEKQWKQELQDWLRRQQKNEKPDESSATKNSNAGAVPKKSETKAERLRRLRRQLMKDLDYRKPKGDRL